MAHFIKEKLNLYFIIISQVFQQARLNLIEGQEDVK